MRKQVKPEGCPSGFSMYECIILFLTKRIAVFQQVTFNPILNHEKYEK